MESHDPQQDERQQGTDPAREPDRPEGSERPRGDDTRQGSDAARTAGPDATEGPQVIGTDAPLISKGPAVESDWASQPDRVMVVQTNRIREPNQPFSPNFVMVPVEAEPSAAGRSGGRGGEGDRGEKGERRNGREGASDQGGRDSSSRSGPKGERKGERGMAENPHDEEKGSHDRDDDRHGRPAQGPSLMKTLLLAGAVALVCGVVGAWGYSALFGPDKSKSGQGQGSGSSGGGGGSGSSKDSGSGGSSGGSGGESGSSKDSSTGRESGSRKNSTSNDKNSGAGKMLEAQSAWLAAVKELHQAKDAEKKARDNDEEKKAVLDFLRRTLLSAGKPGDGSLSAVFWAGGEGKDVSLRQALDATDSQVAGAFTDRPLAEASVRELLGVGYLNIGDPARSVQEYERALSLREANQGPTNPETVSCRNQLAVVYRVAGKTVEAGRLFQQNPNSPTHAAALAARGATLLMEHRAADAEARLREALMIRRKNQPDDWVTFDTESMLGQALLDQKKYDEAEPYLNGGYEGMKQREEKIPVPDRPHITRALERLVRLYESRGEDEKAKKWRQELQVAEATIKPDTTTTTQP